MNDYIRKGVELANGWEITWEKMIPSDFTHVTLPGGITFYLEDHARPQWAIDALAAQLERQFAERAKLWEWINYCSDFRRTPKESGEKITMWRIRYFVDSGVLTVEEGQNDALSR